MGCLNNEYPLLWVTRAEESEAKKKKKERIQEHCSEPGNRLGQSGEEEREELGGWGQEG